MCINFDTLLLMIYSHAETDSRILGRSYARHEYLVAEGVRLQHEPLSNDRRVYRRSARLGGERGHAVPVPEVRGRTELGCQTDADRVAAATSDPAQ